MQSKCVQAETRIVVNNFVAVIIKKFFIKAENAMPNQVGHDV
jgi:hypothetical protein